MSNPFIPKRQQQPIMVAAPKVLVAEDESTQRRLLRAKLEREGYEVIEATDGLQALGIYLDDHAIRLVITDLNMPKMDGFQLIRALRENESRYTYIIVLTSMEDRDSLVKALDLGADDYLRKPVFQKELTLRLAGGRRLISIEGQDEVIMAMVKMAGARSGETGSHLDRVRAYSSILANDLVESNPHLQLKRNRAEDIARVSPLHDIGKVAIADEILNKPGSLTVEEMELMKTHAVIGGDLLLEMQERVGASTYLQLAYEVATYHHERWDGGGYPAGLQGDDIPLAARIVTLADVFDALTIERCYKDAFSYETAKAIVIEASGRHFDPIVVEAYLRHEQEWRNILAEVR